MTAKSHCSRARASSLEPDQISANQNRGVFSRFMPNWVAFVFAASMMLGSAQFAQAQWTTSGTNTTTTNNVGIGTPSPVEKLDVNGSVNLASGYNLTWGGAYGADIPTIIGVSGGSSHIQFRPAGSTSAETMRITANGNVGIGTTSPGYKLDVNGDTNVSGNITASGTINAKYQDVAEWVPSSEQFSAGTVVVLDSTKSNHVTSSSISYDSRVAGVVSAQPGIALGERSDSKSLIATTGRVKVKVDATKSPIHIGDLLVTSDVSGVAMKSEPVNLGGVQLHRPGTLIGKALEPLEKGKGEILVLLSLQ